MSEEQKKDLKVKVTVGSIILVLGTLIIAGGPGLPKVLEHVRKNKTAATSPARYYYIGKLFEWTYRTEQAKQVYEEFWLLYADDGTNQDLDWDAVAQNSAFKEEPWYMPWLVRKMDEKDEKRPAPVRPMDPKTHEILGKCLAALAKIYKDKREYFPSDHLYSCLNALWPKGSELQQIGADGVKAMKMRQF